MSTPINNGGSAFPCGPSGTQITGDDGHSWWQFPASDGMSLRDWFAGQALAGLTNGARGTGWRKSELAKDAFAFADAMLTAKGGK
jgi:hypothetical protein